MNMRSEKYLKRSVNKRKSGMLILSLVLLLAVVAGGTIAYLWANSDKITNTFTPGDVHFEPSETKTETTKSDIQFKNDGTVPVYIRATLVMYWKDTINGSEQMIAPPADAEVDVGNLLNNGWFMVGDIYYYSKPLAPGATTPVMLAPITVTLPDGSTAQCYIDVQAEAIQAEPAGAVEAAWADVDVEDGNLTAAD